MPLSPAGRAARCRVRCSRIDAERIHIQHRAAAARGLCGIFELDLFVPLRRRVIAPDRPKHSIRAKRCQLLRPARRPEVAAQRRGEAYAAVGKQVEAIALAVMPVRTAHVLPADAHAAEHVDEPPVRAEEDLTAVKPICRALDHAERHRRAVFPRRGLQMPHRLVRPCGRHGAVARIVPAQAVKALQDRFAEYDRICSPAAGAEYILHAPHVPCHVAVSYRLRGQRQSHAPTSCLPAYQNSGACASPQKQKGASRPACSELSFVAEKDTARKALRLNGFAVLRILYFCFSALFSSHFRTPILTY